MVNCGSAHTIGFQYAILRTNFYYDSNPFKILFIKIRINYSIFPSQTFAQWLHSS